MNADGGRADARGPGAAAGFRCARARRGWRLRMYALPLFLLACVTLPHLDQGQFNVDTGWYSAIALQSFRAAAQGDFGPLWSLWGYGGDPAAGGAYYFNKPPLAFWVHGLSLWAFGPNLWAARLPAVLAGAGIVLLTVSTVARLAGRRAGAMAGIVLVLTVEFFRHLRSFSLDIWQLLFLLAVIRMAVEAQRTGRMRWLAWSGVPLGLALLTKPFVGLVAAPVLGGWLLYESWRASGEPRPAGGTRLTAGRALMGLALAVGVGAAVAAPWHLSMVVLHGDAFTSAYFGREIAARAAGKLPGINTGADSPLYYARELTKNYWPWLFTVLLSLWAWGRGQIQGRYARAMRLGLVWSGAWLVLLSSFADKRPRYLLVEYPAWSWMSAVFILAAAPAWYTGVRRRIRRFWPWALATACLAVAIAPVDVDRSKEPWWPRVFEAAHAAGLADGRSIWDGGGRDAARGARVYMEMGRWPRLPRDAAGVVVSRPAEGDLVLYHEHDRWGPGPGELVLFKEGPVTLARMGAMDWSPVRLPAP